MDTVTESDMAISMSREGGIGIIHRFLTIEQQVNEVQRVKRSGGVLIEKPYTLKYNQKLGNALALMKEKDVHSILIVDDSNKLTGILTKRDIQFEDNPDTTIMEIMTKKEDLVTGPVNTSMEKAKEIMHKHRIEKLPIIDSEWNIHGLMTLRDIRHKIDHPDASKDRKGRPLVGAAIGVKNDFLERAQKVTDVGCDVLVIDIAHGHSENLLRTLRTLRKDLGDIEIIGGNVATYDGCQDLIAAGVDAVKVGVGPGAACTTRIVTGAGVPQITAIMECARDASVPLIADGGIRFSGDITKAIAAGAHTVMLGNMLAGTDESPGSFIIKNGKKHKVYRGMASFGASFGRKKREFGEADDKILSEIVPEGVEGTVPYRGRVHEVINQLMGGLRSGMSYCGSHTIEELRSNGKFLQMTSAGMNESRPHDVDVV
jgi:IMP dehydrogenase